MFAPCRKHAFFIVLESCMYRRLVSTLALLALALAACQGPPPTQIVLVVTATPTPEEAEQTSATAESQAAATSTPETETTPGETATTAAGTVTPQPLPSVVASPTPIVNQIQVAEQVFEHGRMFWLQPTQQIWVMIVRESGHGDWLIFEDNFEEGEAESDPSLIPPEGFSQPTRGFGKLWRENPDIRDALGWAITPEFGFVTRYEYHTDGGYHILTSLYEEEFRFNEADRTWQIN
jgi:hypothetical protein